MDDDQDDETVAIVASDGYDYPSGPLRSPYAISNVPDVPAPIAAIFFSGKIGRLYQCRCGRVCGDRIWCMMGPCWPMMLLTFSLIIGIAGAVHLWASYYVHWTFIAGGLCLLCFNVVSLMLTSCNNPGILKRQTEAPPGAARWRYHAQSQSYQQPGAKYCDECQVFVHGYDHFCPWTGTAIAGNNLPFFYAFVGSLNFLCVVVFVLVFFSFAASNHSRHRPSHP